MLVSTVNLMMCARSLQGMPLKVFSRLRFEVEVRVSVRMRVT